MRALGYFLREAAASLRRGWRAALLAILTITAGLFVLGFVLMVHANLTRLVGQWSEAAEISVYLRDDASKEQVAAIDATVATSGLSEQRAYVSKEEAAKRFAEDFPDLAGAADRLGRNPFPASFEIRLSRSARDAAEVVDALAANLGAAPGVADVRYDRRWLRRLDAAVGLFRGIGLVVVVLLAFAAALTVANVVRLAAYARRDEIEIMQLVGAPFAFIRGPFVAEGLIQGGLGALGAIAVLWLVFIAGSASFGQRISDGLGVGALTFLPPGQVALLLLGGMLLGCVGGVLVARDVK